MELKVSGALINDVGKGWALLDRDDLKAMGAVLGDLQISSIPQILSSILPPMNHCWAAALAVPVLMSISANSQLCTLIFCFLPFRPTSHPSCPGQ
jgi:hypothetical protein